jgi:transposase
MTHEEYERRVVGMLCWRCGEATRPSHLRQRRCPACSAKWSFHHRRIQWELLKAFCLSTTAHHAARVIGCSYPAAHRTFMSFRLALRDLTDAEKRPLLGELELDESYFGGRRKGKRGRGAAGKVPVFGILERAGRVYTVVVPNCTKETLMAKIRATTVKGSVFHTDEFTSYNDVRSHGRHVPVNHRETFGIGDAHINGIEGFWSFAKRLHRLTHGVDRENFPLYLAEYEWRYNHRRDSMQAVLFKAALSGDLPTLTHA